MIIELSQNDVRVGSFNPDGTIEQWPETDVMGAPYEHINATIYRLSATSFVVLGPDQGRYIEQITFQNALARKVKVDNADS